MPQRLVGVDHGRVLPGGDPLGATVRAQAAILTVLNTQIATMQDQVTAHFGQHPDSELYLSQPGLGVVLSARVLAEFGDDKSRYADARARKNYAGTSPITRQSGKRKFVQARYVHNDRLFDALGQQAFAALNTSPGARAYYDQLRARGTGHRAALRQLGNRLVGILHGCLKTGTNYDEDTAWAYHHHHHQQQQDQKQRLDEQAHGVSEPADAAAKVSFQDDGQGCWTSASARSSWPSSSAARRNLRRAGPGTWQLTASVYCG